ncbi:MAG: metallophosphoesterase family protein [Mariprofundus sp.]
MIGNLSGKGIIDEQSVRCLLEGKQETLLHNGEFTGKPETQIYADASWVLKINGKRAFSSMAVAEKWCLLQIAKEQQYDIYHAQRTWFVYHDSERWLVANITPRLQALHQLDFEALELDERIRLLAELLKIYLVFSTQFNLRLDEGLSNFGLLDSKLYYLDDDIYPWDNFSSLSAMLGNWLRKSTGLALFEQAWEQLGAALQPLLRAYSSDADDMVYEGVVDQLVGDEANESNKTSFLAALRPAYKSTMKQQATGKFKTSEPIGIIADVHANLPAFETVLRLLDARGVKQYLILGDIVGYGPNPSACIELIRARDMFCIRGNHDHYAAHDGDVRVAMGMMAKWTADWTVKQLTNEEKQWLGALPVRHRTADWMAVHGSPVDKSFFNGYVYSMTSERNLNHLKTMGIPVCLHGHSHIQGVFACRKGVYLPLDRSQGKISLQGLDAALVCPGSAGQPRSGEAAIAEAAIFYPDKLEVEMFAEPYDIRPVISDMEKHGFPEKLVARLREGG